MKREFLTASNLLSLSRILLVVPFVLVMVSDLPGARFWGAGILALGVLTDRLDGLLARRLGQETEWGRILDPLADKIGVAALGIVLFVSGILPAWFLGLLLARDLLILAGGLFLRAKTGRVLPSNRTGKIAVGVVAATLGAALLAAPQWLLTPLLAASTVFLVISLVYYTRTFISATRMARTGGPHGTV